MYHNKRKFMNKILLTGLALGKDIGLCPVCNFDFEWLLNNPTSLLWADKIIIPETIHQTIMDKKTSSENTKLSESMKLLFEILDSENLIDIIKLEDYINSDIANQIYEQTKKDVDILSEMFPDIIKKGNQDKCPGELLIGKTHYCSSYVWQIYASLYISRKTNSQIIYTQESLNYLRYKFGASNKLIPNANTSNVIITDVFNALIPHVKIFSDFIFHTKAYCEDCDRLNICENKYLKETETNINKIIEYRNTDELFQIRDGLNEIIHAKSEKNGILTQNDIKDIIDEYKTKSTNINKNMKKYFPKVQKWSNVATLITLPICIAGIISGNPIISGVAGIAATSISSTKAGIDLLKNKYSWVGFLEKKSKK